MHPKSIKIVMNGVLVARHGLIFGEDEAMASRKLFKHLPGPFSAQKQPPPPANKKKTSLKIGVGAMGGALTIHGVMPAWLLGVLDPLPSSARTETRSPVPPPMRPTHYPDSPRQLQNGTEKRHAKLEGKMEGKWNQNGRQMNVKIAPTLKKKNVPPRGVSCLPEASETICCEKDQPSLNINKF